mmetsp:Transcript_27547/g.79281  ORF Transcript_27547/g.79281 Transcript_27547/m.79281 type:complete len:133 (+) Transcript_27547:530-928(+)
MWPRLSSRRVLRFLSSRLRRHRGLDGRRDDAEGVAAGAMTSSESPFGSCTVCIFNRDLTLTVCHAIKASRTHVCDMMFLLYKYPSHLLRSLHEPTRASHRHAAAHTHTCRQAGRQADTSIHPSIPQSDRVRK